MSKAKRSKRTRKTVDRSATTDVVTQLECAFRNPHAALIGALIGGVVPWFGRTLAHDQVPAAWSAGNTTLAGVMLVSTGITSTAALGVLVLINAVANGAGISLAREATCKRRESAKRASATRARRSAKGHDVPATRQVPVRRPSVPSTALTAPVWHDDVIDAEIVSELS